MQTKSILNWKHTFLERVVLTVILLVFSGNCSYSESLQESLRNYFLVKSALQFNEHISNNEWSEAASVAHLYSLTIPILGIGNAPLTGFKSGNTYSSAREFFCRRSHCVYRDHKGFWTFVSRESNDSERCH